MGTTSSLPRGPWNDVGASGLAGLVLYVFPLFVDDLLVVGRLVVVVVYFGGSRAGQLADSRFKFQRPGDKMRVFEI